MKKLKWLFLIGFLGNVFSAQALRLVYQDYKIYIGYKLLKSDSANFVRVNIFHSRVHIGRITMGVNGGQTYMYNNKAKWVWENNYSRDKSEYRYYFPTKELQAYSISNSEIDSTVVFSSPGIIKKTIVWKNNNGRLSTFNEKGEFVSSKHLDGMDYLPDSTDLKFDMVQVVDGERRIYFRNEKEYITVTISKENRLVGIVIHELKKNKNPKVIFEQQYYNNGAQKKFYSLIGNSSITKLYSEKGKMIDYIWHYEAPN